MPHPAIWPMLASLGTATPALPPYIATLDQQTDASLEIARALAQGRVVMLDLRGLTPAQQRSKTREQQGIGLEAAVLLMQRQGAHTRIHAVTAAELAARNETAPHALSLQLADELGQLGTRRPVRTDGYLPMRTITRYLALRDFACPLQTDRDDPSVPPTDFCRRQGQLKLAVRIDLMRSLPGPGSENAKFVRISLDEDSGGTGWHLADQLVHKPLWSSWPNWLEILAPFANRYEIEIAPVDDPGVALRAHKPAQTNPEQEVTDQNDLELGLALSPETGLSMAGPTLGLSGTAKMKWTAHHAVRYKTHEYTLVNASGGQGQPDRAHWIWDREPARKQCSWLTYGAPDKCRFENFLRKYDVIDPGHFSPVSYRNFVPTASATFAAGPERQDHTRFIVRAGVTIAGMLGHQVAGTASAGELIETAVQQQIAFDVDWSDPAFQAEPGVRLQARNGTNDGCLTGHQDGHLSLSACLPTRAQSWGLDAEQRYRWRGHADRCLTADPVTALLHLAPCTLSLLQQWDWQGPVLVSRMSGVPHKLVRTAERVHLLPLGEPADTDTWLNPLMAP